MFTLVKLLRWTIYKFLKFCSVLSKFFRIFLAVYHQNGGRKKCWVMFELFFLVLLLFLDGETSKVKKNQCPKISFLIHAVLFCKILKDFLCRSSHRWCSIEKGGALKNFAKLTRNHLCQSLFLNKVAGWGLQLY